MAGSSLMVQHKRNYNPNLCFSLVGNRDSENISHIDFICDSVVKYSEWIDGLNMFLDKNISSKSTAKYIQQLTDINVKLCLLELGSERIEIPVIPPEISPLPTNYQFYYEEGWCEAIDMSEFEKNGISREQSNESIFSISNVNEINEFTEVETNNSSTFKTRLQKRFENDENRILSPLTVNTNRSNYVPLKNKNTTFTSPFTPVLNVVQSVFDSNRFPTTEAVVNTTNPLTYQDILETPLPPIPPPLLVRSSSLRGSNKSNHSSATSLTDKEEKKQTSEIDEMLDSLAIKNSSGPVNG